MVAPDPPFAPEGSNPFAAFRLRQRDLPPASRLRFARHARALFEWFGLRRILSAVAVATATAVGAWWLLRAPAPAVEDRLPLTAAGAGATTTIPVPGALATGVGADAAAGATGPATGESAILVVHVAGAVQRPGLVTVRPGARVADAIAAAGGATGDADLDALNLAAFATDAGRVYVPLEGEAVPIADAGTAGSAGSPPLRVDLNTATAADLDRLPGIGPSIAAAVVAYRSANGPFRTVEALLKVPGIGPSKLEQFRALVRV